MLPTIGRDLGLVTTGAALAVATLALRRAYASRTAANSARSPPPVRTLRIAASKLERFVAAVFTACGSFEKDAATAAEVLVLADLRGIDSHGVARLASYFRLLQSGEINPRPNVRIVRETASTATLDGDRGLGLIVGPKANALAMKKAAAVGSGWVAVRNTFHYGIAGYYSLAALEQDMIGLSMTNTSCCVAPLWGRERLLGTNPIAIAFPAASERPLVIDLATSTVPLGKVEEFARRAEALLPGWAIGPAGEPTTTPEKVIEGGALLPLGGDFGHGGHKGYCLSAMVDILSAVLSGGRWGPKVDGLVLKRREAGATAAEGEAAEEKEADEAEAGIGHFFGALHIDGFREPNVFKRTMDAWIRTFRGSAPVDESRRVRVPGDPEWAAMDERRRDGVPVKYTVLADLLEVAKASGVPPPFEEGSVDLGGVKRVVAAI